MMARSRASVETAGQGHSSNIGSWLALGECGNGQRPQRHDAILATGEKLTAVAIKRHGFGAVFQAAKRPIRACAFQTAHAHASILRRGGQQLTVW